MTHSVNAHLRSLSPTPVWDWFAQFCDIPHPTFEEAALAAHIVQKARHKGLEVRQDAKGNILIRKPGVAELAQAPRVVLQAHIDMVAQKDPHSDHIFSQDPIRTRIQEGWVYASNTTLGADNGIGAAMGLAVLFADDIVHPPVDLLLTTEEEIGMGGAKAVQSDFLEAPYLINLDSEEEGFLYIGCAGGRDATFSHQWPTVSGQGQAYQLQIEGLKGGHSGIDIHTPRINANVLLTRIMDALWAQDEHLQIAQLKGGNMRNVIPRAAQALLYSQRPLSLDTILPTLQAELGNVESGLSVQLLPVSDVVPALSVEHSRLLVDLLHAIPNGVLRQSADFPDVVETSISLGVLQLQEGALAIHCLMRSLRETPKEALSARLAGIARLAGVQFETDGDYPGWTPEPASPLLRQCEHVFERFYGQKPELKVMPAGLECGLFKAPAPHMQMISFGPNIRDAHSPQERVEIASVERCWQVLLQLLSNPPGNGANSVGANSAS